MLFPRLFPSSCASTEIHREFPAPPFKVVLAGVCSETVYSSQFLLWNPKSLPTPVITVETQFYMFLYSLTGPLPFPWLLPLYVGVSLGWLLEGTVESKQSNYVFHPGFWYSTQVSGTNRLSGDSDDGDNPSLLVTHSLLCWGGCGTVIIDGNNPSLLVTHSSLCWTVQYATPSCFNQCSNANSPLVKLAVLPALTCT